MLASRSLVALAAWALSAAAATDIVWVTDLAVYTVLAPCAQAALTGILDYETASSCDGGEGVTAAHSCICSKAGGSKRTAIMRSISESIDYTCSSTATDDQASASTVLSAYCNQDRFTRFPPPEYPVTQYVVDLPAYSELAPCAQEGLAGIVLGMTWQQCQQDATLLAPCVCTKNQNSAYANSQISASVSYNCDNHAADISSALEVFNGYCGLVNGTTSFPETTNPPGDMTYYIEALPQFKALPSCARDIVSSRVNAQTLSLCPGGPQALASCACLRSELTGAISSSITSGVRVNCQSTTGDNIASALDVWNLYCSAAKGLTTPAGITGSATSKTTKTASGAPSQTGKPNSDNDSKPGASSEPIMTNTALIAGAVVGAVAGTALIAIVAFLFYRRKKKAEAAAALAAVPAPTKPELDSTAISDVGAGSPESPRASLLRSRLDKNASPVSAISTPHGLVPELHSQAPETRELHGQAVISPITPHEAYSQQVYEAPVQGHQQPTSAPQGMMGWQSGPVSQAYEMDGTGSRSHTPALPPRTPELPPR